MEQRTRAYVASAGIVVLFLLVQVGALALVAPFDRAGLQAVENPQDPTNTVVYVVAILIVTAIMLVAIRYAAERALRALLVFASVYLAWFVFRVVIPDLVVLRGINVLAALATALLGVLLYVHPEWYVIDLAGVVMGAGGAGLFGISFGLLPALLLLTVLAVYDAISVYGTEHMLTLASGVMDLKVPIVLVMPLTLSYSYLDAEMPDPTGEVDAETAETAEAVEGAEATEGAEAAANGGDGGETTTDDAGGADEAGPLDRDAIFIGLGDAVIPTVLVASAAFFLDTPSLGVPGIGLTLPALGAMVGMLAGLLVLLWMVLKGRAHAGLPLLNGGTIAGYLVGALASGVSLVRALGLAPYL